MSSFLTEIAVETLLIGVDHKGFKGIVSSDLIGVDGTISMMLKSSCDALMFKNFFKISFSAFKER